MGSSSYSKSGLRVIPGGLSITTGDERFRITAAPENSPPFPVDAMVLEEDTWLVMSADPKISRPLGHPIRFMTDLIEAKPEPLGSVVVRETNPLKLLAVVHDVNQEPTWREEWVEKALKEALNIAEDKAFNSIGLNLLGTKHGKLKEKRFALMLGKTLYDRSFEHLKRIWLIAPITVNRVIIDIIEPWIPVAK